MEDINKIAPVLGNIPKSNCYQVPDKYFESILPRIQEKIAGTLIQEKPVYSPARIRWAYALSIIILITTGVNLVQFMQHSSVNANQQNLSALIEYNNIGLEESLIIETIISTPADSVEPAESVKQLTDVANYLVYDNIDELTIVETLHI